MTKKKARVWISKWESPWGRIWYDVSPLCARPKRHRRRYVQIDKRGNLQTQVFCARHLERLFPNLKMKLGDKPRRVEITMEFCD